MDNVTSNQTFTGFPIPMDSFHVWFGVNIGAYLLSAFAFLLLLLVLYLQGHGRTASGYLVLHQVIVESQISIIHYALYLGRTYNSVHSVSFHSSCRHEMFYYIATVGVAQWGIFQMALNRFIAISVPLAYKAWTKGWVISAQIASCWVIGLACNLSFYLGYDGGFVEYSALASDFRACSYGMIGLPFFLATIFDTYLPLAGAGFLYVLLFLDVARQKCSHGHAAASTTQQNTRLRLARMLFISALVYSLFFMPVPVSITVIPWIYAPQYITPKLWIRTVFFFGFISTPVTFFLFNRDYRRKVFEIWMKITKGTSLPSPNVHPEASHSRVVTFKPSTVTKPGTQSVALSPSRSPEQVNDH